MENTSNQSQTLNKKLTCFLVILFLIIILTQTYAAPVPKSETVLIPGELNDSEENAQYFNMQYEYTFGNNSPQGNLIIGSQKNSMAKSTSAITPVISYRKTYLQKAGLLIATISSEDGSEYSLEITNSCSQNLCNLKTLSTTQKYCIINAIPDYYYFKITRLSGDGNHFLDADFEEGTNDSSPTAKTCSKPIITDFSPNQEITVIQNANQEFKITASDKEK
ncbi:MAG: hypothetical protein NTY48_02725 [Candidatus Diapherotrites archaeon]|nr:hypothetical protein [Candidatus Diapherotrites archaeon]